MLDTDYSFFNKCAMCASAFCFVFLIQFFLVSLQLEIFNHISDLINQLFYKISLTKKRSGTKRQLSASAGQPVFIVMIFKMLHSISIRFIFPLEKPQIFVNITMISWL